MTAQRLDRVLTAYRIGDPDGLYPIFDTTGSTLYPGRWNTATTPVLYTAEHYSTALLEKLVHGNGRLPPNQHFIALTIPNGVSYEVVTPAHLPGWDHADTAVPQAFGAAWQQSRRSLLLLVPSLIAHMERNILLNPDHPEFGQVAYSLHEPVWWDRRLFA